MATQPRRTSNPLSQGDIQRSLIAPAQMARLRSNPVYVIEDGLVNLNSFAANTSCYVEIPVGPYTYRHFDFKLWAPANIPAVTQPRDGKELVNTANITTYIDSIIIEINGKAEWEMTAEELRRWNEYMGIPLSEGVLRIPFGAPNMFWEDNQEDAYQLGTANLRSVKLRIRTKAAWVAGMLPIVGTEYFRARRPLTYFMRTVRNTYTNPAVGKFSLYDLPVGKDCAAFWVQGAGILRMKFVVDDDIVADADNYTLRCMHEAFGKKVLALGPSIVFDCWRDNDGVGMDSVSDSVAERRRGAEFKVELTMATANTVMQVITFQCGLWDQN